MTNASAVVNAIEFVVAISVAIVLFSGPWRQLVLDAARQYLFQLRDRLFLIAADGNVPFSDPTYRAVREMLNSRILRLGDYSIYAYAFEVIRGSDPPKSENGPNLIDEIQKIQDPVVRSNMMLAIAESNYIVLVSMALRSLLAVLCLMPVLVPILSFMALDVIMKGPSGANPLSRRVHNAASLVDAALPASHMKDKTGHAHAT